jgi:pyrimidine operon attenuation protein/uracil phosphoribosyltransferase
MEQMEQLLLSEQQFELTINRLCYELIENFDDFENTVIIGIQTSGAHLANNICKQLFYINPTSKLQHGNLDITFFRDDIHHQKTPLIPSVTSINFEIENKNVILIDDVLFTGRTIRAALDAVLSLGRPKKLELLVLIDRLYSRQLPIQANYIGRVVDTLSNEKVIVNCNENSNKSTVWLKRIQE